MENFEETPLHLVSRYKHPNIAKATQMLHPAGCVFVADLMQVLQILLNNGADTEAVDYRGWTPLHFACIEGATEAAEVQDHCYC